MKAVVVLTDSEAIESGDHGFTIVPTVLGRGKTGLKAGDRVHPGGSSLLFSVLAEAELDGALAFLRSVRDAAGARDQTKIDVAPVDEVSEAVAAAVSGGAGRPPTAARRARHEA